MKTSDYLTVSFTDFVSVDSSEDFFRLIISLYGLVFKRLELYFGGLLYSVYREEVRSFITDCFCIFREDFKN